MCKLLMSINPEHIENIIQGNKKYEYRRQKSKRTPDAIIMYSTSPVQRIVGEVKVLKVIEDTPSNLWRETNVYSGITKSFFNDYFDGKNEAFAYKLGKVTLYPKPITLKSFGIDYAPQSFIYLD